ncbi:MAG: hypothetical protein PVG27_09125 [Chloroflexota bacterium]|jgi:hypothetical protein
MAVGAILAIVSMPLAWQTDGGIVLDVETDWGFSGSGLYMFVASVLMLALIVLPYTRKTRQVALDRPLVYAGLLVVAIAGLVMAVSDLLGGEQTYSLTPLDAPGLWLAIVAMAVTTWGLLELIAERPPAP